MLDTAIYDIHCAKILLYHDIHIHTEEFKSQKEDIDA